MKLICICKNPSCEAFQKQTEIDWDGFSSYHLNNLLLCSCGTKRDLVEQKEQDTSSKLSTIFTPTIDGMTPAERKALLKKRSTADFHKNIEAKKREMDKNVIPK